MDLIRLEDDLKLQIPEIDAQHEALIGLINELHENMLQQADRSVLDGLLQRLLDDTRDHFAYEEELMLETGYPRYQAHRLEHQKLLQRLLDLIGRFRDGELLFSFAVIVELKGWAKVHIANADRMLGVFLSDRRS